MESPEEPQLEGRKGQVWQARVLAPAAAGSENGHKRVGRWGGVFVSLGAKEMGFQHTHKPTPPNQVRKEAVFSMSELKSWCALPP